MRSLSLRALLLRTGWEVCGGGGMRSSELGIGSELCGGVAAPARLESMLLVEARAAAAVGVSSSCRCCGRGDFGGSISMSVASGRSHFDVALLSSSSNAAK